MHLSNCPNLLYQLDKVGTYDHTQIQNCEQLQNAPTIKKYMHCFSHDIEMAWYENLGHCISH